MNTQAITGISTAILIAALLLVLGATASVILGSSEQGTEEDYELMLNEALDEISTYLNIKDIKGKFRLYQGEQYIQQIAILIRPMFSQIIDLSDLTLQLSNGEDLQILYLYQEIYLINGYSLFNHPLWENIDETTFGFIVIRDKDYSMLDFQVLNENTDMSYLIIQLPEEFYFKKGETLEVSIFPTPGIERRLSLRAPPALSSIVSLR
jgi:archaellin